MLIEFVYEKIIYKYNEDSHLTIISQSVNQKKWLILISTSVFVTYFY